MKLYVEDWLHGTSDLTAAEVGVYIQLCALMWERGGAVPHDMARLARRMNGNAGSLSLIVDRLIDLEKVFITADGELANERVMTELERASKDVSRNVSPEHKGKSASGDPSGQLVHFPKNPRKSTVEKSHARAQDAQREDTDVSSKGGVGGKLRDPEPADPQPPDKPKSRRKPERELPDDWIPDMDRARGLMEELELNRTEMNFCYHQMKGHAHATQRRQRDWNQAFANWVRKAAHDGEIGPGSRGRRKPGGSAFGEEI